MRRGKNKRIMYTIFKGIAITAAMIGLLFGTAEGPTNLICAVEIISWGVVILFAYVNGFM